ncbi:MAG: RNA methyltransferase [Deltaproteobacteria bacterium]|nr:RNA methyltransferase [Deltaproteobacteria bacterium]
MARVESIESLADPRVADYRDVKDGALRRREGLFVVEGRGNVRVLVEQSPYPPRSLFVTPASFEALGDTWKQLHARTPVYLAPQEILNEVVGYNVHRGCLAVGERGAEPSFEEIALPCAAGPGSVVVLEHLTDTENVGGVFRNAMAFGADLVVLSPRCCDPLYRRSIRVSMGGSLRVPFARCDTWPGPLQRLRQAGYSLYALSTEAGVFGLEELGGARPLPERVAWLLGAEGEGLSEEVLALADQCVRIPMAPGVDSINVATACGIALHQAFAARSTGGVKP